MLTLLQSSLIGLLEHLSLLRPQGTYVEFGSGKVCVLEISSADFALIRRENCYT